MGERITIEIIQDGMVVASVTGRKDDAERQAAHYALIYGQDGPVEMRTKEPPMTDELKPCGTAIAMQRAALEHGFHLSEDAATRIARRFLTHLADNLPDAMVEAGARAHCDHFGGEGWYSSGQAADSTEAMNAAMRLALAAALNVKGGEI